MIKFITRRLLTLIPIFFLISLISFIIVQLPPGNYLETYIRNMERRGQRVDEAEISRLKQRWGLDQPWYVQYYKWMEDIIVRGNWGRSMMSATGEEIGGKSVNDILKERIPPSIFTSLLALLVTWLIAIPFGIYSATHQYSKIDYAGTVFAFLGLSIPSFLLAIVAMWFTYSVAGHAIYGLFSVEFRDAPWSVDKIFNFLSNIWLPVLVIAFGSTAGLIRVVRANMLDELNQQYVVMARAKGVSELRLLLKYPVRIAFNPILSTVGWLLPFIIGGEVLVSTVLNLPTLGPLLLNATLNQDMYLAGSILLILTLLTLFGTLISDILLAIVDPRIRFTAKQ